MISDRDYFVSGNSVCQYSASRWTDASGYIHKEPEFSSYCFQSLGFDLLTPYVHFALQLFRGGPPTRVGSFTVPLSLSERAYLSVGCDGSDHTFSHF